MFYLVLFLVFLLFYVVPMVSVNILNHLNNNAREIKSDDEYLMALALSLVPLLNIGLAIAILNDYVSLTKLLDKTIRNILVKLLG